MSQGKKGYKNLLVGEGSKVRVQKEPTQDEYDEALKGNMDNHNKNIKLGELNELAYNFHQYQLCCRKFCI